MPNSAFQPCIPSRGTTVPTGTDWVHEIKHDGYRLIVQKDRQRVRLLTRNGWRVLDEEADYGIRETRQLLIEFIGGEPGEQMRDQFA